MKLMYEMPRPLWGKKPWLLQIQDVSSEADVQELARWITRG